jgi:hypothetical protein
MIEKQQVLQQLQSLFVLYNKQKGMIEQLEREKVKDEEWGGWKERVQELERENDVLRLGQSKEIEVLAVKHKAMMQETERRIEELQSKISRAEDEKHRLTRSETELKDQVRDKEKKLAEMEYKLESTKSRLEHEVSLAVKQKEQFKQENILLQKKLAMEQKDDQKHIGNERELRREIARLTYSNEELTEELGRWKKKCTNYRSQAGRVDSEVNDRSVDRLAKIEKKLETILKHQEPENAEDSEEEKSMDGMLKSLTLQILEKEELQNAHLINMFKLDQINIEDKQNEYKNLLKAMAALYFANRYGKIVPTLFECWKHKFQERAEVEEIEEQDNEAEMEDQVQPEGEQEDSENNISLS